MRFRRRQHTCPARTNRHSNLALKNGGNREADYRRDQYSGADAEPDICGTIPFHHGCLSIATTQTGEVQSCAISPCSFSRNPVFHVPSSFTRKLATTRTERVRRVDGFLPADCANEKLGCETGFGSTVTGAWAAEEFFARWSRSHQGLSRKRGSRAVKPRSGTRATNGFNRA